MGGRRAGSAASNGLRTNRHHPTSPNQQPTNRHQQPTETNNHPTDRQLILPEALKLLPLYALALLKSAALRPDVRADERSLWLGAALSLGAGRVMGLLHGRLFPLHRWAGAGIGLLASWQALSSCGGLIRLLFAPNTTLKNTRHNT
jgi:hypothetical protein